MIESLQREPDSRCKSAPRKQGQYGETELEVCHVRRLTIVRTFSYVHSPANDPPGKGYWFFSFWFYGPGYGRALWWGSSDGGGG
ncbi:hypothetical protein ACFX13_007170 [Malus domestica]